MSNLNGPDSPSSAQTQQQPQLIPLKDIQIEKSVAHLDDLATAIKKFKSLYDELTNHLNYIEKSIDARTNHHPITETKPPKATEERTELDLTTLCQKMEGKCLRRYIIGRLHSISKLREELPPAIRAAHNPTRLVLDCIGRFYVQGSKAYEKEAALVPLRRACVLALESFLIGYEEEEVGKKKKKKKNKEEEEEEEALKEAEAWMGRVRAEGGLSVANKIDARGLLLYVACFGIPKGFSDDEVLDLVRAASSNRKRLMLWKSRHLVTRITHILERMMKNDMKIEAIDVVLALGIEDKFPLDKILALYLQGCDEAFKRRSQEAKDNLNLLKEATEKHLTALKSAMKFIEDHRLHGLHPPPGWDLKETIRKLHEENGDLRRKLLDRNAKRRAEQDRADLIQEIKRSRTASTMSIPNVGLNERAIAGHMDGKIPCYSSTLTEVFEDGLSHPVDGYLAAESRMFGSRTGSLPETLLSEQRATYHLNWESSYYRQLYNHSTLDTTFQGSGDGYFPEFVTDRMAGAGSHVHSRGVFPLTVYDGPSTGFINGVQREMEVDRAQQIIGNSGQPNGSSGIRDAAHDDSSVVQGLVGEPASGLIVPSSSIENFVGFPGSPPSGATACSSANLYQFVDAVLEMEYSRFSINAGPLPAVVRSHHSSDLY